ncbi:MAG: hypothetical protein HGA19_15970 [Oscillochloris sp.]|nr:hypothetical protein [Oscillochloris sp.]
MFGSGSTTQEVQRRTRSTHHTALIQPPFPAVARGKDCDGRRFNEQVALHNLCAHSLTIHLTHAMRPGSPLFIVIHIGTKRIEKSATPAIAIRGMVCQAIRVSSESYIVMITFDKHRFLFAPA